MAPALNWKVGGHRGARVNELRSRQPARRYHRPPSPGRRRDRCERVHPAETGCFGGHAPTGVTTVSRGYALAAWREAIIFRTKVPRPLPGRM